MSLVILKVVIFRMSDMLSQLYPSFGTFSIKRPFVEPSARKLLRSVFLIVIFVDKNLSLLDYIKPVTKSNVIYDFDKWGVSVRSINC